MEGGMLATRDLIGTVSVFLFFCAFHIESLAHSLLQQMPAIFKCPASAFVPFRLFLLQDDLDIESCSSLNVLP